MRIDPLRALFSLAVLMSNVSSVTAALHALRTISSTDSSAVSSPSPNITPQANRPISSIQPTPTAVDSIRVSPTVTWDAFPTAGIALNQLAVINYRLVNAPAFESPELYLLLCQTAATTNQPLINDANTWFVSELYCDPTLSNHRSCVDPGLVNLSVTLTPGRDFTASLNLTNFFFCFGYNPEPISGGLDPTNLICNYSSPLFDVFQASESTEPQTPVSVISGISPVPTNLAIHQQTEVLSISLSGSTPTTSITIVHATTSTFFQTPTSTALSPSSVAVSISSSGLSTGAKAGIAVGAVIAAGAIALLVFCLVRWPCSRRTRNQHIMLANSPHGNTARSMDQLAEKPDSPYTNLGGEEAGQLPPHAITLYDDQQPADVAPTSASSYSPQEQSRSVPVLLPPPIINTSQSRAHDRNEEAEEGQDVEATRPLSAAPALSPRSSRSRRSIPLSPSSSHSRRSTTSPDDDSFNEPYQDHPSPVYGDTRHIPITRISRSREAVAALLTEPGMSEEEIARLEEEERRIDAAIAEAERLRHDSDR